MENASDIEDIIPPTPVIQPNKFCSRINKASVTSSKLSKKLLKNDHKDLKRKRLSPDSRKGKQRAKQGTLLNFLVKNNKSTDLISNLNPSSNLKSPVKINLLSKFEETKVKDDEVIQIKTEPNLAKDISSVEKQISSHIIECENKICDEVSSLHLNSQSNETCKELIANSNSSNPENERSESNGKLYNEEKSNNTDKMFSLICELKSNETCMELIANSNSSNSENERTESNGKLYNDEKSNNTDKIFSSMCELKSNDTCMELIANSNSSNPENERTESNGKLYNEEKSNNTDKIFSSMCELKSNETCMELIANSNSSNPENERTESNGKLYNEEKSNNTDKMFSPMCELKSNETCMELIANSNSSNSENERTESNGKLYNDEKSNNTDKIFSSMCELKSNDTCMELIANSNSSNPENERTESNGKLYNEEKSNNTDKIFSSMCELKSNETCMELIANSNSSNPENERTESNGKLYNEEKSNYTDKIFSSMCELKSNDTCMELIANSNSSNPENERTKSNGKLYNEEKSNNTDKMFSSMCELKTNVILCNPKAENTEHNTIHNEEKSKDVDLSFSWMSDVDWEKENGNFDCSYNFVKENISRDCCNLTSKDISIKFKVKEIKKDSSKNEIRLMAIASDNPAVVKNCSLRGFWTDSVVGVGDIVHILNSSSARETVIDNDSGFLVVNPDFLISSTAVVSTLFCMRKAVLNHILPQWSPGNNVMMIGSLVHDIFQKSVNNHARTSEEILKIVKSVMVKRENLIALCYQDMSESEIEEKICKYIPNIIEWINKHCGFHGKNTFENISITNVEDIEENVWCPKYGIKGKIDLTVSVNCQNQAATKVMPLELKTGRPTFSAEHIGQVNLYSLMMEERSKETSDGLLLYLREKAEMKVITTNHNSKRGLIQLRNELASYIYKWVSKKNSHVGEIEECHLPRPINNKRLCEKCPYILPCTMYQKAFFEEKALDPSHAMTVLIPTSTNHLTDSHMEYFLHWSRLLLLENTTTAEIKAFWTEDAVYREKQGMCLSYVVLDEDVIVKQESVTSYFLHTFVRSANNPVSSDFKNSCLKEGDYVAISNQKNPDEVAVAMGYIITVSEQFIELAIDRNLKTLVWLKGLIFRIDKQVSNSAAACVRNNLMLLMKEEDQAKKLRKLIIDKEVPRFLKVLPKQIVLHGRSILKCLNKNQQKAVLKALMAEDYFLIKGMPGTGKTSTIVALARLLVQMKISVLLTSYTHSAIDNILLKLKEHTDFVRIGPKYRINPDILQYSFENLTKDFISVNQYSTFMKEKMVVATTCLGINHAIFKLRKFDVCIVDEASQINQIACLGPLFFAKKFILVGDDKQLPPLVLNTEARKRGMQESLFQRLQNSFSCMELTMQYRMNREIMRLCNELTYSGSLQCGSETIANQVLHLEKESKVNGKTFPPWLLPAFDSDIIKSVLFLNTDNYVSQKSDQNKNDLDADLVILLVQFLFQFQVRNSDIGIIAPYRKQVDLIDTKIKNLNVCGIEVSTVDQYQGRDKDVIIISCAKPSDIQPKAEKGVLLDDEKRLNVAISRARKKLILIGSKTILCGYKPFKDLINCLRQTQCIDVT